MGKEITKAMAYFPVKKGFQNSLVMLTLLGVCLPASLWALNATNSTNAKEPDWMTPPAFTYSAQDRVDPFASFLRSQADTEKEGQNSGRALSPLQQVAPSQLHLVGILDAQDNNSRLALVELPNGKGYILRPGTLIGRNEGIVTVITKDQVTIEEKQTTPWGEEVLHSVVLELPDSSGDGHEQ
ncbi:MAG: pilus assembly protein PilP [Desulfovermiculus sp.]|nr:pilus assembly protein PilP [Desulfovermiculus sp.]